MKKHLVAISIIIITLAAVFNINVSKPSDLSLLSFTNIEALANPEGDTSGGIKVNEIISRTNEIIEYQMTDGALYKIIYHEFMVDCLGSGTISCTPEYRIEEHSRTIADTPT